jgi:hypothetical protein
MSNFELFLFIYFVSFKEITMSIKKLAFAAATIMGLYLIVLADVYADQVETKCRVRPDRSKVSVDGEGLGNGSYYAEVKSGGVIIKSVDVQTISSSGDEVEFDFDSNTNDIAEGATAITFDFIKNRSVTGSIFKTTDNGLTGQLVEDDNAKCRGKKSRMRHGGHDNHHGGHDDGPNHR